jgi:hypothetical protein
MVNIREIGKKFTKDEAKELLEKSKQIIDDKVLGENFKRNKLLNKKNEVKSDVKVDNKPEETINNELVTKIETKTKLPKVDAQKSDDILFKVKKGGKITPTMLDDFNIDKMNSKDDIIKFIDEVAKKYAKDINVRKRGVQSNEETIALSKLLQKDQTKLTNTLLNLNKGETLNAEYILATRELVEASYRKLDELAIKAVDGDDAAVLAFRQHMALTSELTKILKGVQTETGRALQQFRIKTSGDQRFGKVNIEELNRRDLLIEIGGVDELKGFAKVYLNEVQTGKGRVKLVEGVGSATKISEAFSEAFINAILSNPLTHVRNTAGNWITQGIIQAERKVASRFMGDAQRGGVAEYEDIAKAFGKTQAYTEMWAAISKSLKQGKFPTIDSQITGNKVEIRPAKFTAANFNIENKTAANFFDFGGKLLTLNRIPTKFLTQADNYFKNLEYRSELYAIAYRDTVKLIRDGNLAKDKAAAYLADLVVNPTKKMTEQAFEAAKYSTFQTKLGTRGDFLDLGAKLQSLKGSSGPAQFFFNYYLPFIQTPTNVAGFVLERFPIANLALKSYRRDLLGNDPVAKQQAMAKMMLGTAFFTTVMGMTYGGYATGTSPELGTDFKLKGSKYAMMKTLGYGKGTLNIPYGDETFRINMQNIAFDPVAMAFKQAADLSAILQMGFKDRDQVDDYIRMLTAFVYSTGENLASSTFMSGVSKAVSDYQSFENLGFKKGGERWGKGIGVSLIPSIFKQGGKIYGAFTDTNYQKIAVEFDEYVAKALNFAELNKQYDFLGKEVEGFGAYTVEKKSPILDEWLATRVELTPIKKGKTFSKNGLSATVEFTSDEFSFLQLRSGEYNEQNMPTLFESEEYQEADNFYKQALIKDVHSKSKKAAYADLIGQEFDESLGAYEFAENSATRINDKAKEVFENKVISLNFGEPLLRDYFTEE